MPIIQKNNYAGQTPGTTVDVGNSGNSGDPLSHVLPTTGGTITYALVDGRMAVRMTPTGAATPSTRRTISESQGRVMVTRRRFYWDGTTKATARPIQTHHSSPFGSPSTGIAFTQIRANNPQIEACTGAGVAIAASRVHLPAAGWYEIELVSISASASGANDGVIAMYVYAANGTTAVDKTDAGGLTTVQKVFTGQNITNLHPGSVRWGLAPVASVPTNDDLVEEQAMWTDDVNARLSAFESNRTLPAVQDVTITQAIPPTTTGGSNGQLVITWTASTDPDHEGYEIGIAAGLGVTSGFTIVGNAAKNATTYTVTGRTPGPYTVAVRSIPA